jgi:hypothetical protein
MGLEHQTSLQTASDVHAEQIPQIRKICNDQAQLAAHAVTGRHHDIAVKLRAFPTCMMNSCGQRVSRAAREGDLNLERRSQQRSLRGDAAGGVGGPAA